MAHFETPVLIVGGGGFGLTTSICLSHLGVPSLLIERHATPSPMPKARYLNQRTMEIFRQHGVAEQIYAKSLPVEYVSTTRWVTSLGGDGPHDRKMLYEMETFGGGSLRAHYRANSPVESTIYPQVRLEPLLRDHAEALGVGQLKFNCSLTRFEQDAGGVTAWVEDRGTGETHTVRARYLVAADGGKTIGEMVGVKLEGTPELIDMVTMYFRADLSKYLDNDNSFAYWMASPGGDTGSWGTGVLGKLGPTPDRHSEEWMFHFSFKSDDPERFNEDKLIPRMRALMKIPDLQPEVLGVGHWIVQGVLADRYRFGNVFLGGDSAHRHTPTTGLGLNSAIQDAHNLAWKLAWVLQGQASDALLDTYESERRPAAERNVNWALFTFSNHQLTGAAIGLVPGDAKRSETNFKALLADTPDGESRRYRFREVMKLHNTEYQANDLEIGVQYEHGALVPDGTPLPQRDPTGRHYVPSTRPGARLPHAWLEREGQAISTQDLVPRDGFVLITGQADSPWAEAAAQAAEAFGVRITVVPVTDTGAVRDGKHDWRRIREIGDDGALLVRPDQIIAWRCMHAHPRPQAELEAALRVVLRLSQVAA
ncbi:FAD-dependent monooxygenase [Ramlibacter sp.]|uniref:FAD-dependent monooxygenase n=1 Tax=Ramlibacter sp. TaxID=1917967 RepID=UPI0035B4AEB0